MNINEGRQKRRIRETRSGKESQSQRKRGTFARSRVAIALPTFAVFVLRHRAKDQRLTVSAIIETLVLDDILLDEVERLMKQSPEFARLAVEWMRNAVTTKKHRARRGKP
jgi:hypothetical protein